MKIALILTIISVSSHSIAAEVKSDTRVSTSKKNNLKKQLILKQIKMIKSSNNSIKKQRKQA
jgi:hypothetical protein